MVMLSCSSPEYAELIRPEHIETILSSLRTEFEYILLDMGSSLNDCAVTALETADTIFVVVNEDIATLNDSKRSIKLLEALNLQDKIKVVVNKDGLSTIKVRDVTNLLEMEPALVIPNDPKSAMMALNRGVPMLSCAPTSKATKAIVAFARGMIRRT